MFPELTDREKEYQQECDFNTLIRAAEIVDSKERFEGAKEYAQRQKKNLDAILSKDYLKKIGVAK